MPTYRVQDNTTGKSVEFEWHGEGEPTDADMDAVFAEARGGAEEKKPAEWSDLPGNILPSAGRALGGIAQAAGGILKLMDPRPIHNETQLGVAKALTSPVQTAKALGGAVKDRYGSGAALKETLITDPMGALADASMLATGGGGLLRGVGRIAGSPGLLQAGAAAGRAGAALDPLARTGAAVAQKGATLSATASDKARDLMQHVLKPTVELTRRNPNVDIPRTLVNEGVVVSKGGAHRLNTTIEGIEDDMGTAIDQSIAPFIADELTAPLKQSLQTAQVNSPILPEVQTGMQKVYDDFTKNPRINQPTTTTTMVPTPSPILGPNGQPLSTLKATTVPGPPKPVILSAREVQDYKRTLGRSLSSQFGKEMVPGQVEGRQALRSGMREALAQKVPEVAAANSRLGPLYAGQEALERRLHNFGNTDPVSHASKMDYLAGAATGIPLIGAAIGSAVRSPALMSRAAIAMDRTGKAIPAMGRGVQQAASVVRPAASGLMRQALLDAMTRSTETP